MRLAHSFGEHPHPNYNTYDEIVQCLEPIGFDGIYYNVYENRELLKEKDVTLFVMGDYVGKDNSFDDGAPLPEKYCDWNEIMELVKDGAKLGWHTWSHPDLTTLTYEEIVKEVTPPFPMEYFAYPYGRYSDAIIQAVKDAGFKKAWSVTQGDDKTDYTLRREYI